MTEKRQKVTKMYSKCGESTKKSLFMEYTLLYKKNLSFAAAGLQKNSKLFNNRPGEIDFNSNSFISRTLFRLPD